VRPASLPSQAGQGFRGKRVLVRESNKTDRMAEPKGPGLRGAVEVCVYAESPLIQQPFWNVEPMLQIAVLKIAGEGPLGYQTEEIRVEDLLLFLRERYGLYIDRLPPGEGFDEASIEDREALRNNKQAFKSKLREIGFFQDLSDAYITQHVTPRYRIVAQK
jgi:hypothetical protein